jgi:hypothetical protein
MDIHIKKISIYTETVIILSEWRGLNREGNTRWCRKLSIWGRMLEGHCRRQEAFSILESLLGGNGLLQHFGPPPLLGDRLKVWKLVHS